MGKGIIVGANENMNEPVVVDPVLNNNSWEIISEMSNSNKAKDIWAIGDAKQITLNGTVGILELNNYQPYVYILGFNHNAEKEGQNTIHFGFGTTALSEGTNIALVDSSYDTIGSATAFRMSMNGVNTGGWKDSYMRNNICGISKESISGTILGVISADLRNVIKSVTKYTDNTGTSSSQSDVTATTDYFFLLAEYEVFGSITWANTYEANYQQQYAYYAAGNSKIKYKHNDTTTAAHWWLRSPLKSNNDGFEYVRTDGTVYYDTSILALGFAPAFCV